IWNNVFMQYNRVDANTLDKLPAPCVDTGMGLERCTVTLNHMKSVYETDLFAPVLARIREIVENNCPPDKGGGGKPGGCYNEKSGRIIADHTRAATQMIADGVVPKNVDQGYILRRLIRRAIREAYKMGYEQAILSEIASMYIAQFEGIYDSIGVNNAKILEELTMEEGRFGKTLKDGIKEFEKLVRGFAIAFERSGQKVTTISGEKAFRLYDTYGFPIEMTEELAREAGLSVDKTGFNEAFQKHQELSRTASEGKFKGGLADSGTETTELHTATHLLLAGLRKVLGDHVMQAGSNITTERLRFDFTHGEKVTPEQLKAVEDYVNDAIRADATMVMKEVPKEEAKSSGVVGSFWEKYPDIVKVYTMTGSNGVIYTRELCGGPHIETTTGMGIFKIQKEEASGAGVRRIKAVLVK
ncbi:alanine--tRNA ligase, partial [Candidatus Gracilibacteria bacterium]|nr:alanine--tRNA ligase [Candidatus Gracilibacteria bacterium]